MHVILFLNHQCNLRCTYCYNGEKFQRPMSPEMARKGVDLAFTRGDARLSFFGGEPLIGFDTMKVAVEYALEKDAACDTRLRRFSTTVNGTLINEEMLRFFKQEAFFLVVSLDGTREANDTNRIFPDGGPSYDKIVDGLTMAREVMGDIHVSCTVDPSTVHLLAESFDHILSLGTTAVSLNFNYDAKWTEESLATYKAQMQQVGERYVAAYRSGSSLDYTSFTSKINTHLDNGYGATTCKFGDGEVTLTPTGRLYPCERLVGEDPPESPLCIGDIDKGIDLQKVIAFNKAKNGPEPDCRDCHVVDRCIHFCGCVNMATTGKIGAVSGLLCEVEQTLIAQADRAAATLYAEKNSLFLKRFYNV